MFGVNIDDLLVSQPDIIYAPGPLETRRFVYHESYYVEIQNDHLHVTASRRAVKRARSSGKLRV
jgi:hypothetical protein